jgi:photosystem II stability/assembly factor-like uncharacterized protein
MKKFALTFSSLFIPVFLIAQWAQNEAFKGGGIINDIFSYKDKIYIAIADNGLFSSSDNGDSWSKVHIDHDWSIDRLGVHEDTLIVATSGFIFKSADGINWIKLEYPGSFVKSIQSEAENLYVASGSGGIFKSIDNGRSWEHLNDDNTNIGLESFHKSNNILYVGKYDNSGTLYKSADEGQSWQQLNIGRNSAILEIGSNSKGLYINSPEQIMFSDDQGASWSEILNSGASKFMCIQEDIIYVSVNGRIHTSTDNGGNWWNSNYDINGFNFASLHVNAENIFIGMWGGGVARTTIAADEEWSIKNIGLHLDNVHQIRFLNDKLYVGTEFSFVRSSSDNGISWVQEVDNYNNKGGNARHMAVFEEGIYVGSGGSGVISKTEDGSWLSVSDELPGQIVHGLCANETFLFVAISGEGIYRTNDPIDIWEKCGDGVPDLVRELYSFGAYVFAATYNGLYISSDNGESWADLTVDFPDRSINSIALVDSTILAATQNGGAFRSDDLGQTWTKFSGESIRYLHTKGRSIFKCSDVGSLAVTYDLGDSWKRVEGNLPNDSYVTSLGSSNKFLFAGFGRPGHGIWQREIHELVAPVIMTSKDESKDLIIRENEALFFTSDQQLMDENGNPLDSAALQPYIEVKDSKQETASFDAKIDETSTVIEISIVNPTDKEAYIVVIDSIPNQSNLRTSVFTSQPYTYAKNNAPILNDILRGGVENEVINISVDEIMASYQDKEGDPIEILHIISTPENGTLSIGSLTISEDTYIYSNNLGDFTYTPDVDFIGKDTVMWNAFDGYDYSQEISSIILTVDAITGLSLETNKSPSLYPNPSSGMVIVSMINNQLGKINYSVMSVDGKLLDQSSVYKNSETFEHVYSLEDIDPGIYIIVYRSKLFNESFRVIVE